MFLNRFSFAKLALIVLPWPAVAWAQTQPLTLAEAVQRGVDASPDLSAEQAAVDAAQALIAPAGQWADPELVAGVDNLPVNGAEAGSFSADFMTMRKVGLMQALPGYGKRGLRTRRARDALNVAQAQEVITTLDVKRQIAQAWIAVGVAEETVQRLRELKPAFELQAQLAQVGVRSARLPVAEALTSKSALLTFQDRIAVAEQAVQSARAELARWLPNDADRPLGPKPNFGELANTEWVSIVHRHAELAAYDTRLEAAQSDVALAQADRHPDWSVGLMYGKRGALYSDMLSAEVRVTLPIFTGSRQNPAIAAKRAELRKLQSERDVQLRMHTAEVTQRLAEWKTLKRRVAAYRDDLLPLAHQRAHLMVAALPSGRGEIAAVLDAQSQEVDLQLKEIELDGELGNAWAYLTYLQDDRSGT
jgi:outer membrane protein TolC